MGDDASGHQRYLDAGWEVGLICVIGVILFFLTPYIVRGLANVSRGMIRGMLGPITMGERVRSLQASRGVVLDTNAADLRRIERDLHDGAQARLVAVAMDLGMAKEKLESDPDSARRLLDKAHSEAKQAMSDLRDVARGIHPPVLTDRGLDGALATLAARSQVPVELAVNVPSRPGPAAETIAYFL